ncbi:MAG: undecaprenyl-phosphate glucose phosphotransferase [Nitrospinae bacterium]|nr:undecaprenyl-phosphate glucose phosphotransferase [Nitrospinota bacterium]
MLKKYGQLFISILFITDIVIVVISWLLAYYIRFHIEIIPITLGIPSVEQYIKLLPFIVAIYAITMKVLGLYQPMRGRSRGIEFYNILKVTFISILLITATTFFYRGDSYSRIVMVYFWLISSISLMLSRRVSRKVLQILRHKGYNLKHILIVGAGDLGKIVAEKIDLYPEIGFKIVGFLTDHPEKIGSRIRGYTVLGDIGDVKKVVKERSVDQLFVALPLKAYQRIENLLELLGDEMVDVKVVPDLLRFMRLNPGIEELDGLPVVNLTESPLFGWNKVIKRLADILLSLLAIIILSPLMLFISIAIKLTSKGPVLYRQERMGLDGEQFYILKFRSMNIDAEEGIGAVWAKEGDERRTKIGIFLRRISLDELPQLFNVLKGNMSLVGPRPERPVFVDNFKKLIPEYMLRHKMKAGITGWAQVNGWRGDTSLKKRIEYDLYYIENWSFLFDFKIIWLTIWKGLINKNAY